MAQRYKGVKQNKVVKNRKRGINRPGQVIANVFPQPDNKLFIGGQLRKPWYIVIKLYC